MSEYLPRIIDKQIEKYLRVIFNGNNNFAETNSTTTVEVIKAE